MFMYMILMGKNIVLVDMSGQFTTFVYLGQGSRPHLCRAGQMTTFVYLGQWGKGTRRHL